MYVKFGLFQQNMFNQCIEFKLTAKDCPSCTRICYCRPASQVLLASYDSNSTCCGCHCCTHSWQICTSTIYGACLSHSVSISCTHPCYLGRSFSLDLKYNQKIKSMMNIKEIYHDWRFNQLHVNLKGISRASAFLWYKKKHIYIIKEEYFYF